MAQTPSVMVDLGRQAPDFSLPDTKTNKLMSLGQAKGSKGTVIMFLCNHCPYVKHVNDQLIKLSNDYTPLGISFVAINSNDTEAFPEDGPEEMKRVAEALGYPFPYLFDSTQEVARAYEAACTPDFFVYNKSLRLVYRGQLDYARPKNDKPVDGVSIRKALDDLLNGRPIEPNQIPSVGCNIKWKTG